jgi:hypothetical protein
MDYWKEFVDYVGDVSIAADYIGDEFPKGVVDREDMLRHMDLLAMFLEDMFEKRYGTRDVRFQYYVDYVDFKYNYLIAAVDYLYSYRGKQYTAVVELYEDDVRYGKVAEDEKDFSIVVDHILSEVYDRYVAFKGHLEVRK